MMPGRDRPLYIPPAAKQRHANIRNTNGYQASNAYHNNNINDGNHGNQGVNKASQIHHGPIAVMPPEEAVRLGFSALFTNRPTIDVEKAKYHPVMVLSEVFPNAQLEWTEGFGRGDRQFKVEAEVHDRRFFGEGRSKKLAKLNLAKTILLCMYDIHDFKECETVSKIPKPQTEEQIFEKKFPMTQLKEMLGEEELAVEVVQEGGFQNKETAFRATLVVRGQTYEAVGKNKNIAKIRAAKKALEVIRPKKDSTDSEMLNAEGVDVSRHPTMVFYEHFRDVQFIDTESKNDNGSSEYSLEATIENRTFKMTASSKKKAKLRLVLKVFEELKNTMPSEWLTIDVNDVLEDKPVSTNPAANHPIVLLLKLNSQAMFEVTEDPEADPSIRYKSVVKVGDIDYMGEGPNKRTAKTASARVALQQKFGINPDEYVEENKMDYLDEVEPKHEVDAEISDRVAKAVAEKFSQVFKDGTSPKVLAAFVLAKFGEDDDDPLLEVVSLGTGTKCITGDTIDHKGQTLNDCHGEVIACRGFRQFLFDELILAMKNDPESIFQQRKDSDKYELRSNLKVFMFINTAPCGDGRVFTLQTIQQGARNKTAGLLRTKIENGQGTIPVPENSVQTADGILEGERLRTMSCSDKILKWNVLGVQGALLSYFINPIYIQNTVIGLHYHYNALYRALYKRACRVESLPSPYTHNKPYFGTPGSFELTRNTSKASSNSFNWYYRAENIEAVNATTGQTVTLGPSRLCKLQFFDKFSEVLKLAKSQPPPKTYHAGKLLAKEYQHAKEVFFNSLIDTTGGKWIGKPYEHDMFGY